MADDDVVVLTSMDGQSFSVLVRDVKDMCATIKDLIEDSGTEAPIPIPNITGKVLQRIVEYCKYHTENPDPAGFDPVTASISEWDAEFLKRCEDLDMVVDVLLAANFLANTKLVDMVGRFGIAEHIKHMTTDEMREKFGITDKLTPEEESRIRREYTWIEEK